MRLFMRKFLILTTVACLAFTTVFATEDDAESTADVAVTTEAQTPDADDMN